MNACTRSISVAPLAARARRRRGRPRATASTSPRRSSSAGQPAEELARVDVERARSARAPCPRGAARSHGTPPNCSACVSRAARPSAAAGRARRRACGAAWPRLGATNSSRAGASGSSTGNSYWPSTRPARKPEIAPASTAEHGARRARRRRRQRAHALATRSRGRLEHAAHRARFASIQAGAVDRLGDRQRLAAAQAGVGRHEPLALLRGRRRARGTAPGPPPAGAPRRPPPPCPPAASRPCLQDGRRRSARSARARASSRRLSGVRAATTGECGHEVERRRRAGPRTP